MTIQLEQTATPEVIIRPATPDDAQVCGRICYEAFKSIATAHNFPPDFPNVDIPSQVLSMMFSHPRFYCIVAECNGKIVGSNCLDERNAIAGLGPITIDPSVQNKGVGRTLMQAALARTAEHKFAGVRLLQAAYHNRSLSLYAKVGFDAREPLSTMQGPRIKIDMPGYHVQRAQKEHLAACNQLCQQVHGHDRSGELTDGIAQGTALVVERANRITGYASAFGYFGHAISETNDDLQALIASADAFGGPGILVPTCNAGLFRWCLAHGLRVVHPMTLMTIGLYNEPQGAYLPSVLY